MITFEGKFGIKATVLAHSISPQGIQFITYEIEYPRMVLAELNTHGMLVRNSASSRAIPFKKMIEQLTARPVRFGAANPGMQDKGEEHDGLVFPQRKCSAPDAWEEAKGFAVAFAKAFYESGYHKQVYNRLTEPFQMMKTVISGTEWNNFMWLRDHGAADPTIAELARVIKEARARSVPEALRPGEWHLPYVGFTRQDNGVAVYFIRGNDEPEYGAITMADMVILTLDEAIKVSSARCAAVSFRNVDYDVAKSTEVFNRLIGDERKHASAFQHQATPMQPKQNVEWHGPLSYAFAEQVGVACGFVGADINDPFDPFTWEPGVSHVDRDGQLWSAQLRGWVMNRKLIDGENVPG